MPTDAVAFGSAHFGLGVGEIYLDEVGCIGDEAKLTQCSRSSSVHCTHAHSEDAGVRCQGVGKWCNDVAYDCCIFLKSLNNSIYFSIMMYSNIQW